MCRRYERIGKGVGEVFRSGAYPLTHESGCHEHRERVKNRALARNLLQCFGDRRRKATMQTRNRGDYTIAGCELVAEGADLRVQVLSLAAGQCVPWHYHSEI